MFKALILITVFIIGITSINCSDEMASPKSKNIRQLTELEKSIVESDNNFGLKLFKRISEAEKDKNLFISPLSVSMALGMTLNGANGSTEEAMKTTLELEGLNMQQINKSYQSLIELLTNLDPKVVFEIANSIWYRQEFTFKQEFIDTNKIYFNAEVRSLNFNSPDAPTIINQWVDDKTHGKIEEIVDSISSDVVMYLINAIYFKGIWTYEFEKSQTMDDQFNLIEGSVVPCKMMSQKGDFKYVETPDFQAIDLPYGDGDFSMTIFLPKSNKSIDSLIDKFNQTNWNLWINSFRKCEGTIQLPKFTLEYEITLNNILQALGMAIAFDPDNADFSGIYSGTERLFISKVKHKTFIEVNEEGTEAAAATSVEIVLTAVGGPKFTMRADHPFIFVIRENHSHTILFMGKILKPEYLD